MEQLSPSPPHIRPASDPTAELYPWTEMEAFVAYLSASAPRFWGLAGQHIDPSLVSGDVPRLVLQACQAIAKETGQGPGSLSLLSM